MRCRHRHTTHRYWRDGGWCGVVHGVNCAGWISANDGAVVCKDCGHWLSLGQASEEDPRVAVEIRAAQLAVDIADGHMPICEESNPFEQDCERCGYENWGGHVECKPAWHAGHLARCISLHDTEHDKEAG